MSTLFQIVNAKLPRTLTTTDANWQTNKLIELGNADIDTIDQFIETVKEENSFFRGLTKAFINYSVEHTWYLPRNKLDQNKLDETKLDQNKLNQTKLNQNKSDVEEKQTVVDCLKAFLISDLANITIDYWEPVIKIQPGLFLDVQDSVNMWTLACVEKVYQFQGDTIVHISYLNWGTSYDEYVRLGSDRVKFLYNYKKDHIFNFDVQSNIQSTNWDTCKWDICKKEIRYRHANQIWIVGNDAHNKADHAPFGTFLDPETIQSR